MADYSNKADLTVTIENFTPFVGPISEAPLRKIMKLWAQRLRKYLLQEFDTNSQGGGKWKPLKRERREPAPSRISKKNAEQAAIAKHFENQAILVDTGALRMALNPIGGRPGSLEDIKIDSQSATLSIGWGGSELNPPPKKKGKKKAKTPHITIAELAVIHHGGTNTIPARPLLVEPDSGTQKALMDIAENEIMKHMGSK